MTCRGYDPKAVKLGKLIKISASSIHDKHKRGQFLRGFAKIAEGDLRINNRKDSK